MDMYKINCMVNFNKYGLRIVKRQREAFWRNMHVLLEYAIGKVVMHEMTLTKVCSFKESPNIIPFKYEGVDKLNGTEDNGT